jgi:putative hydroxymethylpyrimidine transport system substrate-binding protein
MSRGFSKTPAVGRAAGVSKTAGIIGLLLVLAVAAAAVASGCGGGSSAAGAAATASPAARGAAPEMAQVTLIMDWLPWVLDIPVDVAQQQGYYADAGLTVKQVVPAGATDVPKFVATGKAQFGLYYAPDTLMAVAEGAPLVSIAALMSHAPVGLAMAPGEHAKTPADLKGKVAGVVMIPSTRASFASMLKAGGVSDGDVKVVDPGFSLVAPLLAGKYDAVAVTQFAELVEAEAQGQQLDYLDFRDWGTPDFAFLNIVADREFARAHPATASAFVAATMKGLVYAAAHPEAAVDIYVARHPELKKDLLLAQWRAALPSMATAGGEPAGSQDAATWDALGAWMVKTGLLDKAVDARGAVDDSYLGGS